MQAAKNVYIILAIFLFIPWLAYNIKVYLGLRKNEKKLSIVRLTAFILISAVIVTAVYSHFRFTIGYQIPLVAERAGEIFTKRVEGRLDLSGYQAEMERQNLSNNAMTTVSNDALEQLGFDSKHYLLSLSERNYPMDDGKTVVYLRHDDDQTSLYSILTLQLSNYSWQVVMHDVLSLAKFDEANDSSKIKFLPVKE